MVLYRVPLLEVSLLSLIAYRYSYVGIFLILGEDGGMSAKRQNLEVGFPRKEGELREF